MRLRFLSSLLVASVSLLSLSAHSHAATLTVSSADDSGPGTLRQALANANNETAYPGPDIIQFAPEVRGTIVLATSLPEISSTVDLQGPGAGLLSLSGNGNTRHFTIGSGAQATISGLTLRDGIAPDSGNGDTSGTRSAGSIYNSGTLVLSRCLLDHNSAVGLPLPSNAPFGTLANFGRGGAIVNAGNLTLRGCTLSNNLAQGGDGGGVGTGGAILSGSTASHSLTIENCTFSGNTARGTARNSSGTQDGYSRGGAITVSGGTATLFHATIVGNLSQSGATNTYGEGGGIVVGNATATAQNTLIVGNMALSGASGTGYGPDISGALSGDYNLIGTGTNATLTGSNNKLNVSDAKLGTLGLNGGDTPTIALLPGSPAINAANPHGPHTEDYTDQRGIARPQVGRADIGAFELEFTPNESLVVNTLTDEDDGTSDPTFGTGTSLREAINFANSAPDANTIAFDPNVFNGPKTLPLTLSTLYINGPLTISSPPGGTLTIARSTAANTPVFGILYVENASSSPVSLQGLVISGGKGDNGSGIVNKGNLLLLGCRLTNSQCQNSGGGLKNTGTATLRSCTIAGNTSGIYGGGILNDVGTVTLFDCTISGNSAQISGGGLMNFSGATMLVNCTVAGNKAFYSGGGLATDSSHSGTLDLQNCTVVGNDAPYYSGGISSPSAAAYPPGVVTRTTLSNTLVALNTLGGSASVAGADVSGQFTSQNYNFVGIVDNATGITGTGDQTGTSASPLNAQIEISAGTPLLKDNGGPTQTVRLLPGSLAINNGDPAFDATTLSSDQRGEGYERVRNGRLDVGAFEVQEAVTIVPSLSRVTIDNISPRTNDILTATPVVAQSDGGTLTFSYTWKKNGAVIQGESGPTLDLSKSGNGDKGNVITCTVIATEGTQSSEPVTSGAVTVKNTPPVIPWGAITNGAPKTNDVVQVHVGDITDADGDTVTGAYAWRKNGQIIAGETSSALNLRIAGNGDKGDQISLTCTASDGTDSSSLTSAPVTIVNSAPTATGFLSPFGADTNATLTSGAVGNDVDNDPVSITYIWKKNGVVIPNETGSTLDLSKPGNGDRGDVIGLTTIPSDGQLTGPSETWFANIFNSPPVLTSRSLSMKENTTLSGLVDGRDLDGDSITYQIAYNTRFGKLVLQPNGVFTYTPNKDWHGTDLFQVKGTDSGRASAIGAISITVLPVNGIPVAVADVVKGTEDTPLSIPAATLLKNDSNGEIKGETDALRITKVTVPSGFPGTLKLDVNAQTILFTPKLNWNGTTTFTYTVQDSGKATATAQVTLQIAPVNDAPVAAGGRLTVLGGIMGELPLVGSDAEGDALTFALSIRPTNGTAQVVKVGDKWVLRYQSKVGFSGTDTLSVIARDGKLNSAPATVTITVKPNSAPQLLSLLPNQGSFMAGATVVFEQKVRDINGTANLDAIALLIGNSSKAANAKAGATLWFDAVGNQFTLTKVDGVTALAPVALGGTLENSQVKVTLGANDVARAANGTLTLKWHVTFKPAFVGTKALWMRAEDLGGLSAGFTNAGTLTLTAPAKDAPTNPSAPSA